MAAKVLSALLILGLTLTCSFAATVETLDLWKTDSIEDGISYGGAAMSTKKSSLILTGQYGSDSVTSATLTSWSTSGIGDSYSFEVDVKDYKDCTGIQGGFLTDSDYEDYYYVAFTCTPSSSNSTDVYFFGQMKSDGTIEKQVTLTPTGTNSSQDLMVTFLEKTIVAVVGLDNGTAQQIVGLTGDLELSFQTTSSDTVSIKALGAAGSDAFVLAGVTATSPKTTIFVGTFSSAGAKTAQSFFTIDEESAEVSSVAATSDAINVCMISKDTAWAATFDTKQVTANALGKATVKDLQDSGELACTASDESFAAAVVSKGAPVQAWVYEDDLKSKYSFSGAGKYDGEYGYLTGTATLVDDGDYMITGGQLLNKDAKGGKAIIGYEMTSKTDDSTEKVDDLTSEDKPTPSTCDFTWTVGDTITGGKLEEAKESFTKKIDTDFKSVVSKGDGGNSGAFTFLSVMAAIFAVFF